MNIDSLKTTRDNARVVDTNKWMSINEACAHLKISRTALYKAINAGRIEKTEVLGRPAVKKADVMKYEPRDYPKQGQEGTE